MSDYNDINNTGFPQEPIPHSELPGDLAPQPEFPEDSAPHPEFPEDSAPHPEFPEDSALQTEFPKDSVPQPEFPEDSAPQTELPKDSAPHPEFPEDSAPQTELPKDSAPQPEFPEDSFAPSGFPENSFSPESFSQSEFSQGPQQGYSQHSRLPGNNSMSTAALVLGICSIVFICCGGSAITGGLGIVLALLSRGGGTMDGRAKSGMILSIIGLSLFIIIWGGYLIWFTATGLFDKAWKEYNSVPGSDYYEYNLPYDEDDYNDFWNTPYTDDGTGDTDTKDL